MKILLFGKNGQVSWELQRSLAPVGELITVGSADVNFLSEDSLVRVIREYKPTHIVNAAAYTNVVNSEADEDLAIRINGKAVGVIANEAKKIRAKVLHFSTDYVFNGAKELPYSEDDLPSPVNAYGRSKLIGEKFLQDINCDFIIIRVGWVYGVRGNNFYNTMIKLGKEREELKVVDDQFGAPTWSRHIADASAHILRDASFADKKGLYHLSPKGDTSWYGFAKYIFEAYGRVSNNPPLRVKKVLPISSAEYSSLVLRPMNSRMKSEKIASVFGITLPLWSASFDLMMANQ